MRSKLINWHNSQSKHQFVTFVGWLDRLNLTSLRIPECFFTSRLLANAKLDPDRAVPLVEFGFFLVYFHNSTRVTPICDPAISQPEGSLARWLPALPAPSALTQYSYYETYTRSGYLNAPTLVALAGRYAASTPPRRKES